MKKQIKKLGFTLIELLVVITIIGILATGAVSIYTAQIQKARDSNRVTDVKALQSSIEQAYSDSSIYPEAVKGTTACDPATPGSFGVGCIVALEYISKFPQDKKINSPAAKKATQEYLMYMYNVGNSTSGVPLQTFEVSTAFEAKASLQSKAKNTIDAGNDDERLEVGNNSSLNTVYDTSGDSNCTTVSGNGIKITEDCKF